MYTSNVFAPTSSSLSVSVINLSSIALGVLSFPFVCEKSGVAKAESLSEVTAHGRGTFPRFAFNFSGNGFMITVTNIETSSDH